MAVYYDYKKIHRKISIADQVTIPLNGTDYAFDVIGFNHDALTNGMAYGSSTATDNAGIAFQMHDCFATVYPMNSTNTNSGGWRDCLMRTSTMVTMKGYLPTTWQGIIKPVKKGSGIGNGTTSNIYLTSDECFLLAEGEIFGSTTYSVAEMTYQYAYYKAGNSKVKNRSGSAGSWWERSPHSGNSNRFCYVSSSGNAINFNAVASFGVAFGFCV